MKATKKQIKKALNNTFEFGIDGSRELYNTIRNAENEAIEKSFIPRTRYHYTEKDWNVVYSNIQKMIN